MLSLLNFKPTKLSSAVDGEFFKITFEKLSFLIFILIFLEHITKDRETGI